MTHRDEVQISPTTLRNAHLWTIMFHLVLGVFLYWNAGSVSHTQLGSAILIAVSLLATFPIMSRQYQVKTL